MNTTEMLQSIMNKDYVTTSEQFNQIVREKIDAKIADMRIAIAQKVFGNNSETVQPNVE